MPNDGTKTVALADLPRLLDRLDVWRALCWWESGVIGAIDVAVILGLDIQGLCMLRGLARLAGTAAPRGSSACQS